MNNFESEKYVVVKRSDVVQFLSQQQLRAFKKYLEQIEMNRCMAGKMPNQYYICNQDEPYAEQVKQIILSGEEAKTS